MTTKKNNSDKTIMTNEEYYQNVATHIAAIESSIQETKTIAADVIGKTMLDFDLCFCGLMDRNIHLAEGFIPMLNSRNLTCAGALLRLQLDNCLRIYAIFSAEDEKAAVNCILNGDRLNRLKDKDGKFMTDGHLKTALSKYDKQLPTVYDNASGFIHFSNKAVYQSITQVEDTGFSFQVGPELPEKYNSILIECAQAFTHYYNLFLSFIQAEANWKNQYDESAEEQAK